MAGVHLEAAVVGGRLTACSQRSVGHPVGAQVRLEPAEPGGRIGDVGPPRRVDTHAVEDPAQLPAVATERGEQGVVDVRHGRVVVAGHHRAGAAELVPQRRRGLGQPEVDVALLPQRGEQLDLGGREPGVSEEREPVGEVEPGFAPAQPGDRLRVAHVRRRLADVVEQPAPQLGLPAEVVVELAPGAVRVAPCAPVDDEARALHGVRREDPGQPPRHGPAAGAAQVTFVAGDTVTEVTGEGGRPRFVERGVEHLEQRPDEPVRIPDVVTPAIEQQGDQGTRAQEPDPGTDAVATLGPRAEAVGQSLGQPALDTAGGHRDHVRGEGVGQGRGEQVTELVGQEVGAGGSMDLQAHPSVLLLLTSPPEQAAAGPNLGPAADTLHCRCST